jgi:hypothetical protein
MHVLVRVQRYSSKIGILLHIITMTKQHTNASSGPAPQGDGAPAIRSFPASSCGRFSAPFSVCLPEKASASMVHAGVGVLWASGAVEGTPSFDKLLIAEIYEAMVSAAAEE